MGGSMSFRILDLFHIIHITEDVAELDAWYKDVFGGVPMMDNHYSPLEKRDASIVCVGDTPIEPMAPSDVEGADALPVGRFFKRFGPHLHSVAWYIEGLGDLYDALHERGVRMFADGGFPITERPEAGAIYTQPRDTHTQLEFAPFLNPHDPRKQAGWSSRWWADEHPLGIERLSSVTIVVADAASATTFFTEVLGGRVLERRRSTLTKTDDVAVALGTESVVVLAQPTADDSFARRDLDRNGDILHSLTFEVADLDRAEKYLASRDVRSATRDDETIIMDPDDTYGALLAFTTRTIAGDPRR
jgi:hypothetical protein